MERRGSGDSGHGEASRSDLYVLLLIAAISVLLRSLVNGQYGFHRDELLTYTNARHLDWGYVPYPPHYGFPWPN
jgi:hypothetical protein